MEKDRFVGSEIMFNSELFKWWTLNLNASIYNYKIIGEYNDVIQAQESTNWNIGGMTAFKIGKNTSFQLSSIYRSPSVSIISERAAMFNASAALKQDFLNKKLSLSISIQDIFQTRVREQTTITDTYYLHSLMEQEAPIINLQLTYRLNNVKNINNTVRTNDAEYELFMQ